MIRAVPVARPAALRAAVGRVWLLAGVLALIAGLLGMHVMTSGHASHGVASQGTTSLGVAKRAMPHGAPAGQAAVGHPAGSHSHGATDMPDLLTAACGGSCPGAQEAGAPCIPTAPSGPAAMSPPQAGAVVVPLLPPGGTAGSGYGYVPPGPTPCELSISRT
ncbi:hypothetical protein [Pseudarthrobacter sp. NPDC058119]|uniref:hypothetical protein n=1 Tax=Pseudarthrobacter sp. NPDC058119 TaxID=3346348 RepID=UPI0036DF4E90